MAQRQPSPDHAPAAAERKQGCTAPHPAVSLLLSLTAFGLVAVAVVVLVALL